MATSTRGVFQHPVGSGGWWINFYFAGKRHREKVGRRSDAIALYQKRKTDSRAGLKLPETLRVTRAVLFEDLAKDAVLYSAAHKRSHRGDVCNLNSLLPVFGIPWRLCSHISRHQISRMSRYTLDRIYGMRYITHDVDCSDRRRIRAGIPCLAPAGAERNICVDAPAPATRSTVGSAEGGHAQGIEAFQHERVAL